VDPSILYAAADQRGLWKTTDGGSTWVVLGDPTAAYNYGTTTKYLDSPILLRIDPSNNKHMFCTQGVRGKTLGFWESTDGGANWAMPAGFITAASTIQTRDMTQMAVDPTDFNHLIIGSHSAWTGHTNAGILETKDGGKTFIIHEPISAFTAGSMAINIMYNPELGLGNGNTWLIGTDGNGIWRTTDAGTNWTQVSTYSIPHGGGSIYYTATGVVYSGGSPYPLRSTDNGVHWTQCSNGVAYAYYYTVQGDGTNLYTMKSYASSGSMYNDPYLTSKESDGLTWTAYQGGAQKFGLGPFTMHFDKVNRIMYSANWVVGLWALKVIDPATDVHKGARVNNAVKNISLTKCTLSAGRNSVLVRTITGQYCELTGKVSAAKR
jgi:hypothetical protein